MYIYYFPTFTARLLFSAQHADNEGSRFMYLFEWAKTPLSRWLQKCGGVLKLGGVLNIIHILAYPVFDLLLHARSMRIRGILTKQQTHW
jgi:hypothetical protein